MKKYLAVSLLLISNLGFLPASLRGRDAAIPTSNPLELAKVLNQAFASVADEASRSVVVINVVVRPSAPTSATEPPPEFEELSPELKRFLEERLPLPEKGHVSPSDSSATPVAFDSQGSGVILREDGYILTNRHVVDNAERIEVRLRDGRELVAMVRGVDFASDLAVLKVEARDLPICRLGNSDRARVGEFALAIGAPFELDHTVTFGHVSAKGRSGVLADRSLDQDFIQTDAQINPGNSGGPLVNIEGEVIGINTLVRGLRTGIGFAIPINQARQVADQLIENGRYSRSWLGIAIRSLRESTGLRDLFPEVREGLVVSQIEASGPARHSTLRPGDVIVSIEGQPAEWAHDLKDRVRQKPVGDWIRLGINRAGKILEVSLRTEAMPDKDHTAGVGVERDAWDSDAGALGLKVSVLSDELASREGLEKHQGVIVTEVRAGSLAEQCGLRPGAIVTEINRKAVRNPKQAQELFRATDPSKGVSLSFLSEGSAKFEVLKAIDDVR